MFIWTIDVGPGNEDKLIRRRFRVGPDAAVDVSRNLAARSRHGREYSGNASLHLTAASGTDSLARHHNA